MTSKSSCLVSVRLCACSCVSVSLCAVVLMSINEEREKYQRQHKKNTEIHRYVPAWCGWWWRRWRWRRGVDGGAVAAATVRAFTTCRRCYTLVASNSLRPRNVAVFSLCTFVVYVYKYTYTAHSHTQSSMFDGLFYCYFFFFVYPRRHTT